MSNRYHLQTPLLAVKGIGDKLNQPLAELGLTTVKDLLLFVPLRYEDFSNWLTIDQLKIDPPEGKITLKAMVKSTSQFRRGRRNMQTAQLADETGKLKAQWFKSSWILSSLQDGETYIFSGSYNPKYKSLTQPKFEPLREETIHTGRLVPVYSTIPDLKTGSLRRILKHILDELRVEDDWRAQLDTTLQQKIADLKTAFTQIHFPDTAEAAIAARERLALEEIISLIDHSHRIKQQWQENKQAIALAEKPAEPVPTTVPFELTNAQTRSIDELLTDLTQTTPMNRLLIGDVGSGKTIVAGVAAHTLLQQGSSVCLVAPTQILANQHAETLQQFFPDVQVKLVTGQSAFQTDTPLQPTFFVGTHALINKLQQVQPAMVIYDEQHRFGVAQRNATDELNNLPHHPHVLTMSATPIPRTMMLSIFWHLSLSTLDELPANRIPTKTWLTPRKKYRSSYNWLFEQLEAADKPMTALVVCPFIEQSTTPGFDHIPDVQTIFNQLTEWASKAAPNLKLAQLHGKMKPAAKNAIAERLHTNDIDVLITTPVIEVGLDVPSASIIVIEGAERFGMASLHQLRGRVGRAGQQGYCLLHTSPESKPNQERLKKFASTTNGFELAEYDLQHRGAGNLFGTEQHGFDQLKFADWANPELISTAQAVHQQLAPNELSGSIIQAQATTNRIVANN